MGDLAPTVLGDMRRVLYIFARGINSHSKAFVWYYTAFSYCSGISSIMVEGERVVALPAEYLYKITG